jgi:phosphoglycerate dehydrogenase-like enzyme
LACPSSGINLPGPAADEAARLGIEVLGGPDHLDELLSRADIVSIHLPLTPGTHHMLGPAEFGKMKPSAILINVARGQVVDQAALVDALRSHQIADAGLDVFAVEPLPLSAPLLSLDNVVLTPHVAGATYETSRRRAAAAAENVQRVARGDQGAQAAVHRHVTPESVRPKRSDCRQSESSDAWQAPIREPIIRP